MRPFYLVSMLLLAGCASPPTSFEQAQFQRYQQLADEVDAANADLCGNEVCRPPLKLVSPQSARSIGFAYGMTLNQARTIYVRADGLRVGMSDVEVARLMGHELAHVYLGHMALKPSPSEKQEDDADCVGTIFAVRAGYVATGLPQFMKDRMAAGSQIQRAGYSSDSYADQLIARAAQSAVALKTADKPIDRAAIKDICGVAP